MSSNELRIDDCRGKLGTPGKVLAYRGLSVGMGDSEAEAIAALERAERRLAAWPVVCDPRVGVPNGPGDLLRLINRPAAQIIQLVLFHEVQYAHE